MENSSNIPISIIQALDSSDVDQRRSALIKLIQNYKGPEVEEHVYCMCQKEQNQELKYLAHKALKRLKQNSNGLRSNKNSDVKTLIDQLLKQSPDKRKEVYKRVLESSNDPLKAELLNRLFKDIKAYESRDYLTTLLRENLKKSGAEILPTFIKAIGIFGSEKEVSLLQKYLNHSDPRVIANAVESLDFLGFEYTASMVNHLLTHEDNRVRGNAIGLIFKFNPEKGVKEIVRISLSSKAWMRSTALYCIDTYDFEDKLNLLFEMIQAEFDPELKAKISELIVKFCDLQFAKQFATFIKSNQDQGYQKLLSDICTKLAIDESLLDQEVNDEIIKKSKMDSSKKALSEDSKKREKAKSKIDTQKSQNKVTPKWQIACLTFSLVFAFSIFAFAKIKLIDQKSYIVNPISKRKEIPTDVKKNLMTAERLINSAKYKLATSKLKSYLKLDKSSKRAKFLLSESLILQKQDLDAEKILLKLAKKYPSDFKIFHRIAVLYIYRLNKPDLALKNLQIALKLNPKSIKSLKAMAELHLFKGDKVKAQEYYDTIAELVGSELKLDDYYLGLQRSML
ncbi:MAG: hypothetical protein KC646_08915 [Candidatus Cloacimonetes bacterium]|nr:hypothetical protein [Candidatus Cloacimonadota bacterium]